MPKLVIFRHGGMANKGNSELHQLQGSSLMIDYSSFQYTNVVLCVKGIFQYKQQMVYCARQVCCTVYHGAHHYLRVDWTTRV